jgi:hypothetical protein
MRGFAAAPPDVRKGSAFPINNLYFVVRLRLSSEAKPRIDFSRARKGTALPHIRRRSREEARALPYGRANAPRTLTNRNRKRQEAEREDNQRDDANRDAHRTERFHLFRLWVADVQHHCEQHDVDESAGAAVPEPTEH